ncbi:DUF2020 domain-containing protein [Corynebacterium pacaense]|uniref:DUF2020 domain-containing protein n=1 Tax=Corynebacterium pacaense TaxID=1816684 RepID=UPI0009B9D389|nr:DUF2020 domain-containing protein [Corynebacterium pacaense]
MSRTIPSLAWKTSTLAVSSLLLLGGCSDKPDAGDTGDTGDTVATVDTVEQAPPAVDGGAGVDKLPQVARDSWVECPYLDTEWVADTNGQRVTAVGVDGTFDIPACVFWSYPQEPQLSVIVRTTGSFNEAMDVVDWAAPVDSTELADKPEGWTGGRRGGAGTQGAVYAVARDNNAVVVFTNQEQSLKAQLVAEEVIARLGL